MGAIEPRTIRLRNGSWCVVRAAVQGDAAALIEHQGHMVVTDPHTITEAGEKRRTVEEQRETIATATREEGHLFLVAVEGPDAERAAASGNGPGMLVGALLFRNGDRRKVQHHGHFGLS